MKRIVVLFLACVMTLSLFGCEKDTEAPGSSTVSTGSVSPTEVVTASPEASTPAGTTATATPEPEKKLKTLDYQLYTGCFDGVLIVKNGANKLGLIDESGKLLVDYQYSSGLISVGCFT